MILSTLPYNKVRLYSWLLFMIAVIVRFAVPGVGSWRPFQVVIWAAFSVWVLASALGSAVRRGWIQ